MDQKLFKEELNASAIADVKVGDVTVGYQTLQDIVYKTLIQDILSGKLPPETILNTSDLSRKMKISRTPIREAINKLASVGLVEKTNHREAKVASFLSDEVYELFYIRSALEGLAARSAAKVMDAKTKQYLLDISNRFETILQDEDIDSFMKLDKEFHFLIYSTIKTPIVKGVAEQFYTLTNRGRAASYAISKRGKEVVLEHREIAMAIYSGNEEKAEQCGMQHHANTIRILQQNYAAK